jgi:hypothetical protein
MIVDKPELERLSVQPAGEQLELLLELLPNKIHRINNCSVNFPLYKKLTTPMHHLEINPYGGLQSNFPT